MADKVTLYVAPEDTEVWDEVRRAVEQGGGSLSKAVVEALAQVIRSAKADSEDEDAETDRAVAISGAIHTTLINRFRPLIRRYGWERTSLAFSRALMKESASRGVAAERAVRKKEGRKRAEKAWKKRREAPKSE